MCQHKAQKVERFVGDLVQIVSYGQVCSVSFCGLRFYIGRALDWRRGGRYAVGSGIVVSSIVSHLPGAELDIIISIPHYLLSTHKALIRNRASASCVLEVPLACPHISPLSPVVLGCHVPAFPSGSLCIIAPRSCPGLSNEGERHIREELGKITQAFHTALSASKSTVVISVQSNWLIREGILNVLCRWPRVNREVDE